MINPDILMNLSAEQRGVLSSLTNPQKRFLFSMNDKVLMDMLQMGLEHGVEIVQGLLEVAVRAEVDPLEAFRTAVDTLEKTEADALDQYIAVLQATASIWADKKVLGESRKSMLGTWDEVLPSFNRINWFGMDDLVLEVLINEVSGWLHLTVPDRNETTEEHLTLIQQYIDQYAQGSFVRGVLQLIKTCQRGMYILGSGAHHGKSADVINSFAKEWEALRGELEGWRPELVDALLLERTSRLNSLQKYILSQDVSDTDTVAFFRDRCGDAMAEPTV